MARRYAAYQPALSHRLARLRHSRRFRRQLSTAVATVVAMVGAVVILLPVAWMLSTSVKGKFNVLAIPPEWIPQEPRWDNYREALTFMPFHRYFKNTAVYALGSVIGELVSCAFVAYGFARLRAPGRNALFVLVLSTMMLPYHVTMIPQYILFKTLGWVDTYKPLVIPTFFGSAYLIFLLRQFYMSIPKEMDEAARIDGCSYVGTWWRIVLPLSKPALGALAILSFMWHWNDYVGPLIYISNYDRLPVSMGLANFQASYGGTPWHLLMAVSTVALLPCVAIFFVAQRYFVQGIVVTGVKG